METVSAKVVVITGWVMVRLGLGASLRCGNTGAFPPLLLAKGWPRVGICLMVMMVGEGPDTLGSS